MQRALSVLAWDESQVLLLHQADYQPPNKATVAADLLPLPLAGADFAASGGSSALAPAPLGA